MFRPSPALIRTTFAITLVVIFILAMIPMVVVPEVVAWQDKVHHTAAFAVLMLLGTAGWPGRNMRVAGGLLAYGILIEVCQYAFTINRVAEAADVVADSLGILLGWLVASAWRGYKPAT